MNRVPVYEPWILPQDVEAVARAMRRGWVSSAGEELREFESRWADYCGMPHGVGVTNGTSALQLAFEASGIGTGDEVICPTFTIISCVQAILGVGATPVLVDCDPRTYALDIEQTRAKLTERTAAVLAVHMFGHPVEAEPLLELAAAHELFLVEDAAEAHGSEVRVKGEWRRCGSLGHVSVFSFYANKAITTGEGGMVLTADPALEQRLRSRMNLCFKPHRRFHHDELGHNFRLTNLQAALGLSQLQRLDEILERKRRLAAAYRERLSDLDSLEFQTHASWARPVPWMAGLVLREEAGLDAAELARRLDERGVETRPYFLGMHEQPALIERGLFADERYPVAERLSRRGLYLPSSPTLEEETVDRVCSAVRDALRGETPKARAERRRPDESAAAGRPAGNFGAQYAEAYDAIYADKDYGGEVDVLESCFRRYGEGEIRDLLDLGCGTGRHTVELLERGYRVTGVDRSGFMLARARERIARGGWTPDLVQVPVADLRLPGRKYDAALMLFSVLSYHTTTDRLLAVLRAARAHTRRGGLLIADFWYGPAVLAAPPRRVTRTAADRASRWVRDAEPAHEPREQIVTVEYVLRREGPRGGEAETRERHPMRYFFPREIELLLDSCGYRLMRLGSWPAIDDDPAGDRYHAALVACAG